MGYGQFSVSSRAKAVAAAAVALCSLVIYAEALSPEALPAVSVDETPSSWTAPRANAQTIAHVPSAADGGNVGNGPLALGAPMPSSLMPLPPPDVLELSSADRIAIKVQGQKDLSGDYRINEDQTISIPVLGRVAIAHLDAAGLEKRLSEQLAQVTGRQAYVTVEVIDYRPVFISGYVNKPGTSPWKPGMTVLEAVTLSGGTFRGPGGAAGPNTKAQRAVDDQKRVLATIARLNAEQSGAETIALPPKLIALVGRGEAQALIDAQMTSFLSRRNAAAGQVAGLQRSIALAKEESLAIKAQRDRMAEQLTFRRAQYGRLKDLYNKQYLRLERLTEEQIKISGLEENMASLGVSLSRTASTIVGLERDLANFQQDRRALIDTDLLKLERDAAQLQLEIEAAGPLPRKVIRPLSDMNAEGVQKEQLLFEIVRQDGGVPKTRTVERNTRLRPGDMVVVSLQ